MPKGTSRNVIEGDSYVIKVPYGDGVQFLTWVIANIAEAINYNRFWDIGLFADILASNGLVNIQQRLEPLPKGRTIWVHLNKLGISDHLPVNLDHDLTADHNYWRVLATGELKLLDYGTLFEDSDTMKAEEYVLRIAEALRLYDEK